MSGGINVRGLLIRTFFPCRQLIPAFHGEALGLDLSVPQTQTKT